MNRCKRCGISTAVPGIVLDGEGLCNLCIKHDTIHNEDIRDYAKSMLDEVRSHRGDGSYDAIVCLSGGKDSSYALEQTVKTFGLRALAFTLDNGFLSDYAVNNIHAVVDALGVDHVMVRPNKKVYKEIVRVSATKKIYNIQTLRRISSVCQSCITMVINSAVSLAIEKRAPMVIGGFTLGQVPRGRFGYELAPKMLNQMRADTVAKFNEHTSPDISRYLLIDRHHEASEFTPRLLNPLCAVEIDEAGIVAAVKKLGWQQPTDVDGCSSNCRLNAFANHAHEKRYGYNPYELELADLVRRGLLEREQMIAKITDTVDAVREEIAKELELDAGTEFVPAAAASRQ